MYNVISFLGIGVILLLAWAISADRKRLNWRLIGWGLGLQFVFGLFVFKVPAGQNFFVLVNELVVKVLSAASAGTTFLFGRLALPPGTTSVSGEPSLGFILAVQGLAPIVSFSAFMAVLYYWRILPFIIRGFAYLFTRLMRVSGAESLCAASNIFVGIESTLMVKPHLEKMTKSELCTILTAGMATVASNVMAVYVFSLDKVFPNIAGHLVSASILSAPAALVFSKLLLPETETPDTLGTTVKPHYDRENTVFEAVINGANAGLQLVFGIMALLLAMLGLIALVDLVLNGVGMHINTYFGWSVDWTLKGLLGYCFYPVSLLLGIPPADAMEAARIIGERSILTEIPAYQDLATALANDQFQYPARTAVIVSYALCGFAHVASLAIFVGGVSALVPKRAGDLAKVGLRALLAATLACLVTACVAGVFASGDATVLLGK